uniref:non-specific serine/threonine protein kinase n=1 Tax=Nelumbo nucifera TaxID=4432 RepID=A0A822XT33_NELNU|nr:TPA_asm: hypothetical protein HUJ06_022071 [Nelumbo nucifera]
MRPCCLLLLISSLLLINLSPTYAQLYDVCSNTTSFAPNSLFETNLNILLPSLSSNAINTGFYNTSVGEYPDQVYGLILCRGDITPEVCRNCLETIIDDVKQLCPDRKGATVWFLMCFLRYSDHRFFSSTEELGTVHIQTTTNMTDPDRFLPFVKDFMGNLSFQAAFDPSNSMFAVKKEQFTAFITVYGLMQCTRDLSRNDCYECLQVAMKHYESCCYFNRAKILRFSCFIIIELYPFYQDSSATLSPPLPSITSEGMYGDGSKQTKVVVASVLASLLLPVFVSCLCYIWRRKERTKKRQHTLLLDLKARSSTNLSCKIMQTGKQVNSQELPLIDLATLQVATSNFSLENKLGEGGFGPVYKGVLPNGKKIAVKRLSRSSAQGSEEFKNEVTLIAKLQHKNLVRLLGCCIEREEKMLIYEFMPNSSLNAFLFDRQRNAQLDWSRRLGIINGVARGLLYLHEDSRLKIVHRDIKASNVLLDEEMNPRISDFGMARIFAVYQDQDKTSRVVGTYGYMAPEYAMAGLFSVKSDVFSFGVLLLEIISGKRNNGLQLPELSQSLLTYAWRLWSEGKGLNFLDPSIIDSCPTSQGLRCIHIGLLCVQEVAADRPTMSNVVVMLGSESIALPQPKKPAFLVEHLVINSDQSSSSANVGSVNDVTISNVAPR